MVCELSFSMKRYKSSNYWREKSMKEKKLDKIQCTAHSGDRLSIFQLCLQLLLSNTSAAL